MGYFCILTWGGCICQAAIPLDHPMVTCDLGGGFVIDRRNDPAQHRRLFKIADVFIRFQYFSEFGHLGFLNIDKEI